MPPSVAHNSHDQHRRSTCHQASQRFPLDRVRAIIPGHDHQLHGSAGVGTSEANPRSGDWLVRNAVRECRHGLSGGLCDRAAGLRGLDRPRGHALRLCRRGRSVERGGHGPCPGPIGAGLRRQLELPWEWARPAIFLRPSRSWPSGSRPRQRSLATGIFNSGSNVGAIVAPLGRALADVRLRMADVVHSPGGDRIRLGRPVVRRLRAGGGFAAARKKRPPAAELPPPASGYPAAPSWFALLAYRQTWVFCRRHRSHVAHLVVLSVLAARVFQQTIRPRPRTSRSSLGDGLLDDVRRQHGWADGFRRTCSAAAGRSMPPARRLC